MKDTVGIGPGLDWPPLVEGVLVQRYKRFMADVRLPDGRVVTAHCPNSGRMWGCSEPGRPVFLSRHATVRRRLPYTWEMIAMPASLVGVNTLVPNRLVGAALAARAVPELAAYTWRRAEVPVGAHARIDHLLTQGAARCLVEVKNCTLVRAGVAAFPDAVTARGLKHLRELARRRAAGDRCVMFFLVQRMDAGGFAPAWDIDPVYARELQTVHAAGVEILVYDVALDLKTIRLNRRLPHDLQR